MNLFNLNPYRVLGIKANATAPEKQRVKNSIAAYLKVGKPPVLDFDLSPPLADINRSQELIDLKSNEILSDSDKLKHSLFWFISGGTIDDIALSNLTKSKDLEKALSIFEKGSLGFIVSERSITSIVNHSSLEIITYPEHKDKHRLKNAIENKLAIASSDSSLTMLVKLLNPDNPKALSIQIKPAIIEMTKSLLKDLFPLEKEEKLYLEFFSGQKDIIEKIKEQNNQKRIRTIKVFVHECQEKRVQILENESGRSLLIKSAQIGDSLITKTEALLSEMRNSHGASSMIVTNIYEEVFDEVNYCCVGASNKFQQNFGDLIKGQARNQLKLFVKSAGKFCYDDIVNLNDRAYNIIHAIDTPVRNTIKKNLEVLKSTRNDWRSVSDTVAANNSTGGGGFTGTSTGSKGGSTGTSAGSDFVEIAGGCLVGIIEMFGGWIIIGAIAFLASLAGC